MLKPGFIVAIAMWAFPGPCAASFFYQNEPDTSLEASEGFNIGGTDYFLLKLRIYYRTKGIAAFPDGGQPKVAFESIYLFKLDKSGPQKLAELGMAAGLSSVYFTTSEIRAAPNGALIKIPWMDRTYYSKKLNPDKKGSAGKDIYYFFDAASAKISVVNNPGGEWPKKTRSLSETGKPFRDFSGFDAAGLPNPLAYTPGADKPSGLARLISKGLGDRRLRLAAARRLIVSGEAEMLRSAIAALDKKASALKLYFWAEEKALLEKILAGGGENKGE